MDTNGTQYDVRYPCVGGCRILWLESRNVPQHRARAVGFAGITYLLTIFYLLVLIDVYLKNNHPSWSSTVELSGVEYLRPIARAPHNCTRHVIRWKGNPIETTRIQNGRYWYPQTLQHKEPKVWTRLSPRGAVGSIQTMRAWTVLPTLLILGFLQLTSLRTCERKSCRNELSHHVLPFQFCWHDKFDILWQHQGPVCARDKLYSVPLLLFHRMLRSSSS